MLIAVGHDILTIAQARHFGYPLGMLGNPLELGVLYMRDDETGERFTKLGKASAVREMLAAFERGDATIKIADSDFPLTKEGWPEEVADGLDSN